MRGWALAVIETSTLDAKLCLSTVAGGMGQTTLQFCAVLVPFDH